MTLWQKWKTRLFRWEFWPFYVFYLPVFFYFIWLAVRRRSFFFFTATNPTMDFGGMTGEKKSEIFKLMPTDSYPTTILIEEEMRADIIAHAERIGFPLVVKPDIGERGRGVEIIRSSEDLIEYMKRMPVSFLLQERVMFPVELGVFYVRLPSEERGKITSIVQKKFLSVVGDGQSTVRQLLRSELRAALQLDYTKSFVLELLDTVPAQGEELIIEPIGNHCRGTLFLDATHEGDDQLNAAIDQLAKQIDGFYYGRFDLKCETIDDLRQLKNFKVVELNGVGAEPAHIYQPGFSLIKAYRIVFWHFSKMAEISRQNKKRGIPYWSLRRGIKKMLDIRSYNRRLLHP